VRRLAPLLILGLLLVGRSSLAERFVAFESGPVRPLALSPDGSRLFAANIPDGRLEIFSVDEAGLTLLDSVRVGLEPVAVAARSNREVWVVNHLSDSVSIVDVGSHPARVVRTLLVGDEPRDIVFAGPRVEGSFRRAFVTTARRGQNLPPSVPANLTTPGTPRALVWVFDAERLGDGLGGTPEAILELFGDTPRALAATPDGATVYAAIFHSGNQTTVVSEGSVCNGGAAAPACGIDGIQTPAGLPNGQAPGGLPAPNLDANGLPGAETGLIVKLDRTRGEWHDELGRNWSNAVRFHLPDYDVFEIDALADPPLQKRAHAHVGTVLFNMAVNPHNGKVYVSNTEARNEVRFEGRGTRSTTVRGRLHEARITVIEGEEVRPRHLNKHIAALPQGYRTIPMPPEIKEDSLSMPMDLVIGGDGSVYVAAFGSSKVGKLDATALEEDSFVPSAASHIEVSGGGPCGLALDEPRQRLYVLTRFDNAVKVIDTTTRTEVGTYPLFNPEPPAIVQGRPFLYDSRATSSNGEASCASCHVFGDLDSLAWDLGNPDEVIKPNNNPVGPIASTDPFFPLKGPMTTQTLRGLAQGGPMHWRGDRSGAEYFGDEKAFDTRLAFNAFNVAFDLLVGLDAGEIAEAKMQAFTDFALQIRMPPNPIRSLDNQLTPAQARGRDTFLLNRDTGVVACRGCHTLEPANGFFGTTGRTTFDDETQQFKVPQLRNMYAKVGMFGTAEPHFPGLPLSSRQFQGDQVRGFGFIHDGSAARIFDFLFISSFRLSEQERLDLEDYLFAFETTFAPIVGQQVTLGGGNHAAAGERLDLLLDRARTPFALVNEPTARECDLTVQGVIEGQARGYLLEPSTGLFRSDRRSEARLGDAPLRELARAAGQELTYTCVPPGSGERMALDRDGDGFFDRDELDAGSDPGDASDTPFGLPTPTPTAGPTPTPTRVTPRCVGDCNRDASVTIDELIIGVNVAQGMQPLSTCPSFDQNGDGEVTVDELIMGVGTALGLPGYLCRL
jgi:DNA-binding beta-propeller fold protein YncE